MTGFCAGWRSGPLLLLGLALGACSQSGFRAPVINGNTAPIAAGPGGQVVVRSGDSLYKIAKRENVGLRALIDANRISPPYTIYPGQALNLPGTARPATVARRADPARTPATAARSGNDYIVVRGDTVFAISDRNGIEPGALVRANGLRPPYRLSPGDRLTIPARTIVPAPIPGGGAPARTVEVASVPVARPQAAVSSQPVDPPPAASPEPPPAASVQTARRSPDPEPLAEPPPNSGGGFLWPVSGEVIARFGSIGKGLQNDGLNIAAPRGAPVRAVEHGVVAYAGNELRGFGNLLLLKHADGWISAYAHNDSLLVRTGDRVQRGQVISRVGSTGSVDKPQLHFELRRGNRAVDPERYLGRQTAREISSAD